MSELLEDVETEEALQHVLAFLNDCEPQEDSYSQEATTSHSYPRNAAESLSVTHSEQRKRTLRLAAKTRYRSRVKEEYSRLQSKVRELEATLTQLQGVDSDPQPAVDQQALTGGSANGSIEESSTSFSVTRQTVNREYKRRKQSETVNCELKDLLASFERAASATKAAWDKVLTKKNLVMLQQQPTCDSIQRRRIAGFPSSTDSLFMRIDRLSIDTDTHFDRAGLNNFNAYSFQTQRAVDPALDSAFEITMSSPLPCSKEHAASQILGLFKRSDRSVSRQQIKVSDKETINKSVKSIRFGHQHFKMEGIGTRRKIMEADRIRLLWTTLSYLSNTTLTIREDCIMALQCTSASTPSCLLQIWYRVNAEPSSPDLELDPESDVLKESVLRSHCRTTGEFFQSLEKMLANEVYNPYPNMSS